MKRTITVIAVTERLLNNPNKTPIFFSLWGEIGKMRGGSGKWDNSWLKYH